MSNTQDPIFIRWQTWVQHFCKMTLLHLHYDIYIHIDIYKEQHTLTAHDAYQNIHTHCFIIAVS